MRNILNTLDSVIFEDEVDNSILFCSSHEFPCAAKSTKSIYKQANQSAAQNTGYKHGDDLWGRTDADLRCPVAESAEQFVYQDQQITQSGIVHNIINIHPYADNKTHYYQTIKLPIINQQLETSGVFWVDIPLANGYLLSKHLEFLAPSSNPWGFNGNFSYLIKHSFDQFQLTSMESEIIFHLVRKRSLSWISDHLGYIEKDLIAQISIIANKMNCTNVAQIIEASIIHQLHLNIPCHMVKNKAFGLILPNNRGKF